MARHFQAAEDETAIVAAIEDNLYSFGLSQFPKWPRMEVEDTPQMLRFLCSVPSPELNTVHRAHLTNEDVDSAVSATQQQYGSRGLPISWWLGPSSTPLDLSRTLIAHHFQPAGETTGMARALSADMAAPIGPTQIEIAHDHDSLYEFSRTMSLGFETPALIAGPMIELTMSMGVDDASVINILGRAGSRAVATATLYLDAGVAGVYNVATLPEARGQGYGTAVTQAALHSAAQRGYRVTVLHASASAVSLYERLGFKKYCYFQHYQWSP